MGTAFPVPSSVRANGLPQITFRSSAIRWEPPTLSPSCLGGGFDRCVRPNVLRDRPLPSGECAPFVLYYSRDVAAPDTRCRQQEGVPNPQAIATQENTSRHTVTVPGIHRRGCSRSCVDHAAARTPTRRAGAGRQHPAGSRLGESAANAHRRGRRRRHPVTIRHIVQGRDKPLDAKVIDATLVRHEGGDED